MSNFITLQLDTDIDLLSTLVEQCKDYFLLLDGYLPDEAGILQLFKDVPPNHPLEGLSIYGLLEEDQLLGAIWCYRGYPKEKDAYIGLLLVAENQRKKGIGTQLYQFVEKVLKQDSFQRIQLAVLRDNESACLFWKKLGFQLFKEHPARQLGDKWHELLEFEKRIDL